MNTPEKNEVSHSEEAPEDDFGLLDFALILAASKRLILGLPLLFGALALGISLALPNRYMGTVRLLPPQQGQSAAAAMLSQLGGGLAGIAGGNLGLKNPGDMYVGMLNSRTIADALVERFKLQELFDASTREDARRELAKRSSIVSGKDGIIVIAFEDRDANLAADIANAYFEELDKLTQSLAITEAAGRRLFFERQLGKVRDELAAAEMSLKETQERTGLIQLTDQGRAIIESVAKLKAEIAMRELQLASLKAYATEQHPDFKRLQSEISAMRGQVARSEQGQTKGKGDILVPTGKVPETSLDYVRKLREVKYQESMLEFVAKQYELARIDEAKDAVVIQVIDKAIPMDKKSSPKRAMIVVVAMLGGACLALVLVFFRNLYHRARNDAVQADKLSRLVVHLRTR